MLTLGPKSISWYMAQGNSYLYKKRGSERFRRDHLGIVCSRRKSETKPMATSRGRDEVEQSFHGISAVKSHIE